ncbi:MAG: erythromycin esterase family protein, partial [Myxococcales bacterium]
IARCLIEEKGFRAVVVEADWPDAFRVNRFARGASVDAVIHVGRPRAAEPRERTVRWESAEPPETYPWLV